MENLVTIIVPIYQAEKYIRCCIESILAQHYTNWELLLINDGSSDHSGVICDEYSISDKRIHVYHQTNQGVSAARNKGLKEAKGDYLLFIDADDQIKSNALSILINLAQSNQLSILQYGIISYRDKLELEESSSIIPIIHIHNNLNEYHSFQYGVWGYLIHRDIYKNEYFTEGVRYAEDIEFITKCLACANRLGITNQILYLLRLHDNSAMANLNTYKQVADHLIVIRNLYKYEEGKNENVKCFINSQIIRLIKSYFSFFINNKTTAQEISQINQDYRSVYPLFSSQTWKDKIAFMMAYLDIRLYIGFLRFYVSKSIN